jgi:hypothetical protein
MKLAKSKTPQLETPNRNNLDSPNKASQDNEIELPLSPEIKSIIRRKVSSYLNCQLTMTPPPSKQLTIVKKNKPLPKEFIEYSNLYEFVKDEKLAFHLYK